MKYFNIINRWERYFNNNEFKKLYSLYDKNAILIPTFSKNIITTKSSLPLYFEREEVKNTKVKINSTLMKEFYHNKIIYGDYIFEKDDIEFLANYTFFLRYDNFNSEYKINHHHSSFVYEDPKNKK